MVANLTSIYKKACQIRAFEESIAGAANDGLVPGLVHLCTGAEVFEATVCASLESGKDIVTGSHRSHGLAIGMGADPYATAAEILGKAEGLSGGLGGTQHLIAPHSGFLTSNGIVGAQVPIAAGAALSAKVRQNGSIGVCVFGDGAANQGAVLETMNLAVSLELPLLFILENNGLGQSTSTDYATGGISISARAKAFGLNAEEIKAEDIKATAKLLRTVINEVRTNRKPSFIEAIVPRLSGHYHGDKYSTDLASSKEVDPVASLEEMLIPLDPNLSSKCAAWCAEVSDKVKLALSSPAPHQNSLTEWEHNWRASQ